MWRWLAGFIRGRMFKKMQREKLGLAEREETGNNKKRGEQEAGGSWNKQAKMLIEKCFVICFFG